MSEKKYKSCLEEGCKKNQVIISREKKRIILYPS